MSSTPSSVSSRAKAAREQLLAMNSPQGDSSQAVVGNQTENSGDVQTAQDAVERQPVIEPTQAPNVIADQQPKKSESIDMEDWEGRYKNLRAHGDARLKEANDKIAELERTVREQASRIESLTPPKEEPKPFHIDDSTREQMGNETADAMEKPCQAC